MLINRSNFLNIHKIWFEFNTFYQFKRLHSWVSMSMVPSQSIFQSFCQVTCIWMTFCCWEATCSKFRHLLKIIASALPKCIFHKKIKFKYYVTGETTLNTFFEILLGLAFKKIVRIHTLPPLKWCTQPTLTTMKLNNI